MGQYYTPIIQRKNKYEGFYAHHYNNGLKLMEHSYIGNSFVETVAKELLHNKGRLAWVGDYAEPEDVKNELASNFIEKEREFGNTNKYSKPIVVNDNENCVLLLLINHSKKVFVDMRKYLRLAKEDEMGLIVHPLPLLTAIGNGKGGGDYHANTCREMIGSWACDEIEIGLLDEKCQTYQDITEEVLFDEYN